MLLFSDETFDQQISQLTTMWRILPRVSQDDNATRTVKKSTITFELTYYLLPQRQRLARQCAATTPTLPAITFSSLAMSLSKNYHDVPTKPLPTLSSVPNYRIVRC